MVKISKREIINYKLTNEELNYVSETFLNCSFESPQNCWEIIEMVSLHCKDWRKRPVPITVRDIQYQSEEVAHRTFAIATTTWIVVAGLIQLSIVIGLNYFYKDLHVTWTFVRRKSNLEADTEVELESDHEAGQAAIPEAHLQTGSDLETLPKLWRILFLAVSPIMLSTSIIYLYGCWEFRGALFCFKDQNGKTQEEDKKKKASR